MRRNSRKLDDQLISAARMGDKERVIFLLRMGADSDVLDMNGNTAISVAKNDEIARILKEWKTKI